MPDYIAGWKTADDWRALKQQLVKGGGTALWKTAFEEFFVARLKARYLEPISIMQEKGTFTGEGFSITTIQCSLVEFLESTVQGSSYDVQKKLVFRNDLQKALQNFIESYGVDLLQSADLQAAFIRKFDALCIE